MKSLTSKQDQAPWVPRKNNKNRQQQNQHRSYYARSNTKMSEPKVIVVTGGSKGIGLAVVQDLLRASHKVVLVARSPFGVSDLLKDYPDQIKFLSADMTVPDVSWSSRKVMGFTSGERKIDGGPNVY